ncbi:VWA domain-containing protein [Sphingomonas sp. ID1715]|uniref:vWA domain-containing protein n=1 Tax=Sphingomonas sp. ID1715 TaxID=1656898 RepID=UPI0014882810|nr:VWA domain-containing protein [Sphingomonas sp. ID1715]NNM75303.1 VWA domain-containing protein [Sphingomonas sp. ID1715]
MRRLPVYLLLDTSGSMRGEPIEAVNTGLKVMMSSLRQDPHALETVHIAIITFDAEAKLVVPLTPLDELQVPEIVTPESGPTHLGMALELLVGRLKRDLIRSTPERKGDWAPFLFVMTDGKPSDTMLFEDHCPIVRRQGFANIVGCLAGPKARRQDLEPLCDHIVSLDTMDSAAFNSFFKWVTSTIAGGSRSMGLQGEVPLPPPPAEIQLVI